MGRKPRKKTISVKIETLYLDTFDRPLKELVEYLLDPGKNYSREYSDLRITEESDWYGRGGDYITWFELWGDRLENDKEYNRRIKKEQKENEKRSKKALELEKKERLELERLMKKYGAHKDGKY